ncbi:cobalamin-binding protein [Pandoraea thiooxydans]|uniref:Cobalamin-binding protein n=1 Tax=Pandoraea thiooxydans TaxID=445709 RepID=A0A0G3EQE0_9BURK|nr:helical backbone metal receptor [Pandoraea thiooxydans]AKJ69303.1 cobalamin-binding protein [Pandoraea thiooxydans]
MASDVEPAMLIDAAGHAHAPAGPDARIVSLVPSITELLCDLDLAPQLVGRTGFCIHPHHIVHSVTKVGGTKAVKLDTLRALAPSHVIVNVDENEKPTVEQIAGFVPHIVVTHPCEPADNLALYRLLGGIFDRQRQAEALCGALTARLASLQAQRFPPRRVLYLIWKDPWMTVAPDTYIAGMLRQIGWQTLPVMPATRYPAFSLDASWLRDVDLVLLSSEPYRFQADHAVALRNEPALAGKPVHLIDGEMVSWYGSRAIAGLDYLQAFARRVAADGPDSGSA